MSTADYSFLEEVWNQPRSLNNVATDCRLDLAKNKSIAEPIRREVQSGNKYYKKLDNIMDAYIDNKCSGTNVANDPVMVHKVQPPRTVFNIDNVEGYSTSKPSFAEAYEVNNMYYDEVNCAPNSEIRDNESKRQMQVEQEEQERQERQYIQEEQERRYIQEEQSACDNNNNNNNNMRKTMTTQEERRKKMMMENFEENEQQNHQSQYQNQNYMELIIYILSGVFIIFVMEQILQIGRRIK